LYQTIEIVEFNYYTTATWLPYETATTGPFSMISQGKQWGEKWQYGWFKGTVIVPAEYAGKRIELISDFGGESTIYVNGKLAGAKDYLHKVLPLSLQALPGEPFEIVAEVYAGHDRDLPVYGRSRVVAVHEEFYQFNIDLKALLQLRNGLEPSSLRVSEIDQCFLQLIAEMDWTAAGEGIEDMARTGRLIMKPLLDCVNGSTSPKLFMMGQSHLDIAWLWPMEETKRKIARTLSNQLSLLEEYPEYRYVQSQPYLLQLTKALYPELYARIKRYVAEGRIILEGGMWVEPDTNIPSGESLIRQFLYGKRFFHEEFGVDNQLLWLPDVFGYSGNLPQIMQKCGIDYFATVKMFQTYDNIAAPFPFNTFTWEGIDGSEVLVHLLDYGIYPNPADVSYAINQWKERVQQEGISSRLVQFGYGDGGGGANRDDLEFLRRMTNLEGVPQTVITSPITYFEDLQERGVPDARYVGELYYPAHRGTLTSQAKMKQGNRRSEFALREVELWNALSARSGKLTYPKAQVDDLWRKLLMLQFHDILPGTSITRVHEEAEKAFGEVLQSAELLIQEATTALTDRSDQGVTLFNSLAWERTDVIELPVSYSGAKYANGESLTIQAQQDRLLARVTVPSMGYLSLYPADNVKTGIAVNIVKSVNTVKAATNSLENQWLKVSLNEYGEIISIYDKQTNSEWLNGLGNRFLLYQDTPSNFDAWEIDRRYAAAGVELEEPASLTVIAEGPLYAAIRVERIINHSTLVQEIRLDADGRSVEFHTVVDWKEKHKLLKVGFDLNLHTTESLNEIQFGYIKRPNHASRKHDADQYEVSQHKWSAMVEGDRCFSLLNDCKYGLNVEGTRMNLTLLRAPTWPDERADEGRHEFTYAIHTWNEGFMSNPVVREAYELNCQMLVVPGIVEQSSELLTFDRANIVIDTVKLAEDGSGDLIVRSYESKGAAVRCMLTVGFDIETACVTDMLEEGSVEELQESTFSNKIALSFTSFEVKTIRISPRIVRSL
ncbi:MAG: alpha-mannosidase, partial [Gorillibacterium sp.]|nr:alpha-mannosidase [Gorillibacterium sp.]